MSAARWRLRSRDTFDGPLDPARWKTYWGPGHAGNGRRDPSAISVRGGRLVLTARDVDGQVVSGGLAMRTGQTYGRWAFRVRTDADPSGVTSGAVLTWPDSERWPADGETDVYETLRDPARRSFQSAVHWAGPAAQDRQTYFSHAKVDATRWHDMVLEWEPDALRVYRDGVLAWEVTDPAAIPHTPQHLCIQLDAFAPAMTGTVRMEVADVRVWARA